MKSESNYFKGVEIMKEKSASMCLAALLLLSSMMIAGCDKVACLRTQETESTTEETRSEVATVPTEATRTMYEDPAATEVLATENSVLQSTEEYTKPAYNESETEEATESVTTEIPIADPAENEPPTTVPAEPEAPGETLPSATESAEETTPATEPSVELDYGAAMAYGNSYAANTYGCVYKPELDWHTDGTGYDFGGDYFVEQIVNNGGQDMLNRLMADKVDATFGEWRFPDGCAGIGVECICYEEDGTVWFYVFYG